MVPDGVASTGRMHFEGSPEEDGGNTKTVSDDIHLADCRSYGDPVSKTPD